MDDGKQQLGCLYVSRPDVFLSFRNYVFQKRYVKFDGKNLMYFGSEKVGLVHVREALHSSN